MRAPTINGVELLTGPNLAALCTLPGIGEKRALTLAQRFHTWHTLLTISTEALIETLGNRTGERLAGHLAEYRPDHPPAAPLPPGVSVVSKFEDHYPARLRDLPDAPTLLWWQGTLPPATPTLAVVGTRTPNGFGSQVAYLVAQQAALRGFATISGLALGVDSLGHYACIDAGQPTWAVLGQGIDTLPARGERADLAARILATGGGLLSEVPPGTPVAAHLLTKRNRLQSGLSAATFIAQSGLASGSKPAGTLHTARFALQQGRYLAVAAPPAVDSGDPALAGNVALTSPHGTDPAHLHITDPDLAALVRARTPVADLSVTGIADLDALWTYLSDASAAGQ